ncbi:putative enzyme related to lactoylglutathione lyase [Nakamurella flavida]|uniref:VOC family protein n=1 Tax=Nakamurella flavida TaxID=363630 RepID=UPI002789751A|nr:VOC family protein [Nakamurella flavida]MDP9778497.1 putative enzyme related to lactoylglutathione lyase [Nakamurella flavida]
MPSALVHITIDSADPFALATFWSAVTGHPVSDEDEPGDDEVLVELPGGPGLLFIRVPEGKAGKNRVHLDVRPTKGTRDAEVDRLLVLGATLLDDRRDPDGPGWAVLADPEGNEFCVERGEAERGRSTPD